MKVLLVLLSCLQLSLLAGESVNSRHAEVRLLSNLQSQQDETFYLGIEMAMDKGGILIGKIQVILECF